ncbi:KR domain-containing protein [Xylariomycetidae sp. FL2044]|nr:KR domain-containing protein [Xylariomycetidae sp. FL2044]
MENPALFNSALRSALQEEAQGVVIIEIGPHPALGGPVRQILSHMKRSDIHVGTISREVGSQESLLDLAGKLFQYNVSVDLSVVCPAGNFITLEDVPWLNGHEIDGKIVFPGAAYIAMVGEAPRQLDGGNTTFTIRNVRISSALIFGSGEQNEVITSLKASSSDSEESSPWYEFTITSRSGSKWFRNCAGEARASRAISAPLVSLHSLQKPFPRKVDAHNWYRILSPLSRVRRLDEILYRSLHRRRKQVRVQGPATANEAQLVSGSASSKADVQRAIETAAIPVAGVINLAVVLNDVDLTEMTFANWKTAVDPKVQGTWNLHNAVPSDLDFFVLVSSLGGIIGQLGQANYASASTFLDAFVQYRHRSGLVASVIDVGVMGDVHSPVQGLDKPFRCRGRRGGDLAYENPSQVLLGLMTSIPISSPQNRVGWKHDARMAIYQSWDKSTKVNVEKTKKKSHRIVLEAEESEEGKNRIIAEAVAGALANFLSKNEDSILPLTGCSTALVWTPWSPWRSGIGFVSKSVSRWACLRLYRVRRCFIWEII